jgi:hypothetical protein
MLSARRDRGISWSSLPLEDTEAKLGQLLRFSAYWRYITEPLLSQTAWIRSGNWTQRLRGRMNPVEHEDELGTLRTVTANVLDWAASLQAMSGPRWQPGLWDTSGFHIRSHEPTPREPVALADGPFPGAEASFDELVRAETGEPHPRGAAQVYETLVGNDPSLSAGNHKGYGPVVAAAYRAMMPQAGKEA